MQSNAGMYAIYSLLQKSLRDGGQVGNSPARLNGGMDSGIRHKHVGLLCEVHMYLWYFSYTEGCLLGGEGPDSEPLWARSLRRRSIRRGKLHRCCACGTHRIYCIPMYLVVLVCEATLQYRGGYAPIVYM